MKPQEIFLSTLVTLLVGDSLCEFTVKERNIEFKAVLAYEPKK
nr:Hok/Gef family protein [Escherichia coli]